MVSWWCKSWIKALSSTRLCSWAEALGVNSWSSQFGVAHCGLPGTILVAGTLTCAMFLKLLIWTLAMCLESLIWTEDWRVHFKGTCTSLQCTTPVQNLFLCNVNAHVVTDCQFCIMCAMEMCVVNLCVQFADKLWSFKLNCLKLWSVARCCCHWQCAATTSNAYYI